MTTKLKRGQIVEIKNHTARITGETTTGKSGKLFYAVEVAKMQIGLRGKPAKIIGWGKAQWVREELINA